MPNYRNEHEGQAITLAIGLFLDTYALDTPRPELERQVVAMVTFIINAAVEQFAQRILTETEEVVADARRIAHGHQPTKTPTNPKPPKSGTGVKPATTAPTDLEPPKSRTGVKRDCCAYHRSGGPLVNSCGGDRHRPGEGPKRSAGDIYALFRRKPSETHEQHGTRIKAVRNEIFDKGFAMGWREAILWAKEQANEWPEEVAPKD